MASGEQEIQLVIFRLGVEEYGVPITQVQEINLLSKPTKIPNSPVFLEGVINLRGRIIPVVDLKKRFALDHTKYTKDARIMIVEVNESVIGVIVDEVLEVLRLPAGSIEPPPPVIAGITAAYLDGVGKLDDRLFILLNMDKVLTVSEQEELEQVESMADSGEILIQEG
ncbi:MAG: chemotaxis protein CheW [Thermacetogeniaceae bacterium]|jgi:purine-binding chemotaxis protein CheW|nr:chemotaxis protein CheW [Thermoanaerobacterales bacterium]NLN22330.1 chemotaxis protein CheW [Syntrophomonadaceae bacterium]